MPPYVHSFCSVMETCTMPSPSPSRRRSLTQSKKGVSLTSFGSKKISLRNIKAHKQASGNLPDRIPRVHISADDEGGKEIELSDDPYDCMRLDVENVPCIVTLCKVSSHSQSLD